MNLTQDQLKKHINDAYKVLGVTSIEVDANQLKVFAKFAELLTNSDAEPIYQYLGIDGWKDCTKYRYDDHMGDKRIVYLRASHSKAEPIYVIESGADTLIVSKERFDSWTSAKRIIGTHSKAEQDAELYKEVRDLCLLICNSTADTPIKGEIESRAFALGHFPQILNHSITKG